MAELSDPKDSSPRVLIAEDHFVVANALKQLLESQSYTVLGPAPTISAALQLIDAEPIDVAILDVDLRGQIVAPVADQLASRAIPFLFLTGYSGLMLLPEAYRSQPCLSKPYESQQLLDAIGDLLGHVGA